MKQHEVSVSGRKDLQTSILQLGRTIACSITMSHRGIPPLLLLLASLCSFHCGINPVPEPPSGDPLDPPVVENIILFPIQPQTGEKMSIDAGPGTAEPGTSLWAVNIDDTGPAVVVDVNADGSFALKIEAKANDEVRFQLRSDTRRSEPIDLIVPDDTGPGTLATRALADCLLLTPPTELELPASTGSEPPAALISIENRCSTDVTFSDIRLRVPSEAFAVQGSEMIVAPGNTVQVTVQAFGASEKEEVLILKTQSPAVDRRPITLFSHGGVSGLSPVCSLVGGTCLSDPYDVTYPADCEALGMQTMQATCEATNLSCCLQLP